VPGLVTMRHYWLRARNL